MKLGFIGTGNMGGAIIRALSDKEDITLYGINQTREKLEQLANETSLTPCASIQELTAASDIIILAVKPQQMETVWPQLVPALTKDTCVVSIVAGLTVESLQEHCQNICPVIRAMPNTPVLNKQGVTAVCLDDKTLTETQKAAVIRIFEQVGDVPILPESQLDAFTALIGSGPAFIFYLIETMIESGVSMGLERTASSQMVKKLFYGASHMALFTEEHISMLKEMSIAPAGTTIAALNHFDRSGLRGTMIDAIEQAFIRSKELG